MLMNVLMPWCPVVYAKLLFILLREPEKIEGVQKVEGAQKVKGAKQV